MTSSETAYALAVVLLALMLAALIYERVRPSSTPKRHLRLRTLVDKDDDFVEPAEDVAGNPAATTPEVPLKLPRRKRE